MLRERSAASLGLEVSLRMSAPEACAPESYTDEQMEEFDQLMEPWLEDYERKRSAVGK
jgi:hypothetical protein